MQKRTKNWLWIAAGIAAFLFMLGVAAVVGVGYVFYEQFSMKAAFVQPADAANQLDEIRARFKGQPPKLTFTETDGRHDVKVAPPVGHPTSLTQLHVAAFDPRENKLVRMTLPFWLLRMAPEGKMQVNGDDMLNHLSTPSGRLTASDIEALGPGLLVDQTDPHGVQVIIWTE